VHGIESKERVGVEKCVRLFTTGEDEIARDERNTHPTFYEEDRVK
jgi:hypothetical protein